MRHARTVLCGGCRATGIPTATHVRLPTEKVEMILHCLVEGDSVRGTARLCNVEKRTVLNMLTLAGEACERLFTNRMKNILVLGLFSNHAR